MTLYKRLPPWGDCRHAEAIAILDLITIPHTSNTSPTTNPNASADVRLIVVLVCHLVEDVDCQAGDGICSVQSTGAMYEQCPHLLVDNAIADDRFDCRYDPALAECLKAKQRLMLSHMHATR